MFFDIPTYYESFCFQDTGIGKVVNGLRKRNDNVGVLSQNLVKKWKSTSVPGSNNVREHCSNPPPAVSAPIRQPHANLSSFVGGSSSQQKMQSLKRKSSFDNTSSPLQASLARLPQLDDDPDISELLNSSSSSIPSTSSGQQNSAPKVEEYVITSKRAKTNVFSGRARPRSFAQGKLH